MKTYLSAFLPGPCEGFIEEKDIKKEEFRTIYRNMDYKTLESTFSVLKHFPQPKQ